MEIKTITIVDYPKLIEFWKTHYVVTELDSLDRTKIFLKMNPDLSIYAVEGDVIIGTVLGSFDGRRGYLQKVVTNKNFRKKGIGQLLVKEVIKRLEKVDAIDIRLNCANELVPFYEKCGFTSKIKPLLTMIFPVSGNRIIGIFKPR